MCVYVSVVSAAALSLFLGFCDNSISLSNVTDTRNVANCNYTFHVRASNGYFHCFVQFSMGNSKRNEGVVNG